ncbi:unnamed protein product [Candida verbasci]|uniref:Uncharacterized protein n=1 Tax=Candida verbasci TaxID=1227364 RepID=A0A9W4X9E3_9ASCO|nr:unnamed protein product [Candida verbasci]
MLIESIIESAYDTNVPKILFIGVAQIFNFLNEENYKLNLRFKSDIKAITLSKTIKIPNTYFIALFLFLKFDSKILNLSALNIILYFLNNGSQFDEAFKFEKFKHIFPRIIDLLGYSNDLPYILDSTSILTDICGNHQLLNEEIYKCNIDARLIKILNSKYKSNKLLKDLKHLKRESNRGKLLINFLDLGHFDELNGISNLLLLLSVFTNTLEQYRNRIIKNDFETNLSQLIFEIIDTYYFLLEQLKISFKLLNLNKVKKEDFNWLNSNVSILISILNSKLFTNCFYFIRSISRSVGTLRTFFVECNSLINFKNYQESENPSNQSQVSEVAYSSFITRNENQSISTNNTTSASTGGFIIDFLEIVANFENLDNYLKFFIQQEQHLIKTLKIQKTNQTIVIGLLANFILDFSSFRYKILGYENFLNNLSNIYEMNTTDDIELSEEDKFQKNTIQLKILQFIKNLLYNEATDYKLDIIECNFSMLYILRKASIGLIKIDLNNSSEISQLLIQQKIVSFEILKNFTAGSPNHNQLIIKEYEDPFYSIFQNELPNNWSSFLVENIMNVKLFLSDPDSDSDFFKDETLSQLLYNTDYVKLVTSINYIEDHKFTQIDTIKKSIFPTDELLTIWKRLLSFELKVDKIQSNHLNQIKISIVWIIINLTWNVNYQTESDAHDYSHYEVYQTVNSKQLNDNINLFEGFDDDINFNYDLDLNKQELNVFDRIKILDSFGFTKIIKKLINKYKSDYVVVKFNKFEIQNNHALYEKLQVAMKQIINGMKEPNRKEKKETAKEKDKESSSQTVDDSPTPRNSDDDDELRYQRSNRRDAIDSEDNDESYDDRDDQEDPDMDDEEGIDEDMDVDDDDDDEDDDEEIEGEEESNDNDNDGNDTNDSDDVPTEYWVM